MLLRCSLCKRDFDVKHDLLECPYCNETLFFEYEDEYKRGLYFDKEDKSIWRFNLLPINRKCKVSLGEGYTYMHIARNISKYLKYEGEIYLKDETLNPTGSFVDRGVSIAISSIKCRGYKIVSTISPGNIGASLAAYSSKAGIKAKIYIPSEIERGKLYQVLIYGGETHVIRDIDEGIQYILRMWNENSIYPLLPNNPYYLEGIKTISYEIAEDLNMNIPDVIIVPMGSGGLIYAIWKGFKELHRLELIDKLPRMIGVQVEGASPIVDMILGESIEKSIEVPELTLSKPLNKILAIEAIKESRGYAIRVEYDKVIQDLRRIANYEGIFVEIAAATTITALEKVLDLINPESILCILTGHGLKDPVTVRELVRNIIRELDVDVFEKRGVGRTKIRILEAILKGETYGYSIWKYLNSRGIKIRLPTVYQHLNELDKMGLIKLVSKRGLGRQMAIYKLTEKGEKLLRYLL